MGGRSSMSHGKISSKPETPAGTVNTIQGVAVLGYGHGDAAAHPTTTWVTR
jgi:hypothetical protein